jgi:V8-like Glu-specific endopeptidase
MNKLIAALGLILLTATGVSASTLAEINNSTHILYEGGVGVCSGQFISATEFVTAAHCVSNKIDYSIVLPKTDEDGTLFSKETVYLDIVKVDAKGDVALLKTRNPARAFKFVDVAKLGPEFGETLYLAAYPEVDWGLFLTNGTYNGVFQTIFEESLSYSVSIDTAPGSSGGGLYRKIGDEYFLTGMVQGGPPEHDYMSFFSTLVSLNGLLAR